MVGEAAEEKKVTPIAKAVLTLQWSFVILIIS